jgi:hypothetical protein
MKVKRVRLRNGLAGRSKDGKTIYIDVLVPKKDIRPIVEHEKAEGKLMREKNYDYNYAHRLATQEEKKYVSGSWKRYDKRMRKIAKRIYKRQIGKEPPDLYWGSRWHQTKHKREYYKKRKE